jgi:hypothetical protein
MKLLDSSHGSQCFAFEHSKQYQKVQFDFLDAVESFDPQNIIVSTEYFLLIPATYINENFIYRTLFSFTRTISMHFFKSAKSVA